MRIIKRQRNHLNSSNCCSPKLLFVNFTTILILNLKCQHLVLPWATKGLVGKLKFQIQNLFSSWNITWCTLDMKQNSPLNRKLSPILCYSGYLTNLHFDLERAFHHLSEKFTNLGCNLHTLHTNGTILVAAEQLRPTHTRQVAFLLFSQYFVTSANNNNHKAHEYI